MIECFNKFFENKIKREKKIAYYYTSSYKYNKYWKVLYGLPFSNFQEVEENLNFDMTLFFDSYGIPISYNLFMKEKFSEKKLKEIKDLLKISKFILVSTQESEIKSKNFIFRNTKRNFKRDKVESDRKRYRNR